MRDRLIELIEKEIDTKAAGINAEWLADYLLANGVIVPPCKVGDEVYLVGETTRQIVSAEIVTISTSKNDCYLHLENGTWVSCSQQIGKSVFLTKEEAEQVLKGGV